MGKKIKRQINGCLALALSISMAGTGIAVVPVFAEPGFEEATPAEAGFILGDENPVSNEEMEVATSSDGQVLAGIELFSAIGSLWPADYGSNADFLQDGNGTKENPYKIDSVEDLRGLAAYVASGQDSADQYYMIKNGTYDLNGVWIPIGFALNSGGSYVAFKGHLAGEEGATIVNIGFSYGTAGVTSTQAASIRSQANVGFFGQIGAGATVEGLTIETSGNTLEGAENAGILAGYAIDATIKNCVVSGSVKGNQYVGGLIGHVEASSSASGIRGSVIEDCNAENVAVYITSAGDTYGAVGGIAGYARNTSITDVYVKTNTGSGNHIYGNSAYCGGIAGISENSDIYNSYVKSGEIGSSNAYANGGIVGGYNGGQIKVARFGGTVIIPSSTNNYSASFIGTRVNNAGFTYGESGNIAYLFTDSKTKADTGICGSKIQDDNNYGADAHIGYWHSADKKYTLVTGSNTNDSEDYFYEELEKGILSINQYGNNTGQFVINHFTADSQGNPVRGYLLTVNDPKVSGTTAAKITAQIKESYRPVVTSENQGAFAAGDRIYVYFSNQSSGGVQFKPDPDKSPNPYYTYNEYSAYNTVAANKEGLDENAGYWLTMPESDTIISAEYKATAQAVTLNPVKAIFEITQQRSGDRDNPVIKWYVTAKDDTGSILDDARGNKWEKIELKTDSDNPDFYIGSLVNGSENELFNLLWSTGNTNNTTIINNAESVNGNTADKEAKFSINVTDSQIVTQANELRAIQLASGNKNAITTTSPYVYHALIKGTAQTNDATIANDPPKGYLDIDIKFNITDETTVSIDGVSLSKNAITYDVVRTLTGDRKNPATTYTVNGSDDTISQIEAIFHPDYFSSSKVKWYLTNTGTDRDEAVTADESKMDDGTLNVAMDMVNGLNDYHYGLITLKGVESSSCTNTFIASYVNTQNTQYSSQMKQVPGTIYTYNRDVKVTAYDNNNHVVTDTCNVTVNFRTVDNTVIHPESIKINETADVVYDLSYTTKGDISSEVVSKDGFTDVTQLTAAVTPQYTDSLQVPYDSSVVWSSSDPDVLTVDQTGKITPVQDSKWIKNLMLTYPYSAAKTVTIYAKTNDQANLCVASKNITVNFHVESIALNMKKMTFDMVLTRNSAWSGMDAKKLDAKVTTVTNSVTPIYEILEGSEYIQVDAAGNVMPKTDAVWITDIKALNKNNSGTKRAVIAVKTTDGIPVEQCEVTLNLTYVYSTSSGSSSSSGGGGGGSSSSGITTSGTKTATAQLPSYVVSGTWVQTAGGMWLFTGKGRTYANEWGAVQNPYANTSAGQSAFDWFHFNKEGYMQTGWFADTDGNVYYLHTESDGTLGRMYTGWHWINGKCYYFNPVSDGTKGKLFKSCTTPDGYTVNENGEWTVNGTAQTK